MRSELDRKNTELANRDIELQREKSRYGSLEEDEILEQIRD